MNANPNIAAIAALIADPSRAAILSILLGGHSLPAGELARHAHISAQTASAHLAKMVAGRLLCVTQTGRHRYYSLGSQEVARALETLALIAPMQRVSSLREGLEGQALRYGRTCYDHLAGTLGVMVTQALLDRQFISQCGEAFEVSSEGAGWFRTLGIDVQALYQMRRYFAITCIDWSERKPHLAGALGAAINKQLFEKGWIMRRDESRAVKVTELGCRMFEQELGIK